MLEIHVTSFNLAAKALNRSDHIQIGAVFLRVSLHLPLLEVALKETLDDDEVNPWGKKKGKKGEEEKA